MIRNANTAVDCASLRSRASRDAFTDSSERSELQARLIVDAVATLRILVPVALITAIVFAGHLPEPRIDSAMAARADSTEVAKVAAQSYFPAEFVNQGVGAEEHVPNF